jgi:hypothetical protein
MAGANRRQKSRRSNVSKRHRGARRLAVVVALVVTAVTGVSAPPAAADTYAACSSGNGCLPDNFTHSYCWGTGFTSTNLRNAANAAMSVLDGQSSYSDSFHSACDSIIDIDFQPISSTTIRGDYICNYFNGAFTNGHAECENSRVRINSTSLLGDALNRQKTACHEIGHSAGLSHDTGNDDCMISGPVTSGHTTYNAHHVGHLNNQN